MNGIENVVKGQNILTIIIVMVIGADIIVAMFISYSQYLIYPILEEGKGGGAGNGGEGELLQFAN
ncbi:hypothetical protein Glove_50g67 [Diversispora epigaea]|uniref:Uncharacterized protein n=1 Tax=Diversispora epigaea TaxID=1348612 RepID=A0A397JDZ6_9GLOM|nr:hypothetical protein Glove_50g67 [Diversispora epigaea]